MYEDENKDHGFRFFGAEAGPSATPTPFNHAVVRGPVEPTKAGAGRDVKSTDAGREAIRTHVALPIPVITAPFVEPSHPGKMVSGSAPNPVNPPAKSVMVTPNRPTPPRPSAASLVSTPSPSTPSSQAGPGALTPGRLAAFTLTGADTIDPNLDSSSAPTVAAPPPPGINPDADFFRLGNRPRRAGRQVS